VQLGAKPQPSAFAAASSGATADWAAEATARGVPPPDTEPLAVDGTRIPLVWRRHYVVALEGEASPEVLARLDALGFEVIRFEARSTWPAAFERLLEALGRAP
jgi:uncharacterized protein (DUF1800 family)